MYHLILLFKLLAALVRTDGYCTLPSGELAGVVTAGSYVVVTGASEDYLLVYSHKHGQCWLSKSVFQEPGYIHPDDLLSTMRWQTLVNRWLVYFPTLSTELVLSVIYAETAGTPHAVDVTGNDVRLVGEASVGVMGAIPRVNLPCYATLTSENGKDEYGCQIYLGMYILDWAVRRAHEIRTHETELELRITPMTDEDIRLALALYNCSEESVLSNSCAPWGGLNYADKILDVVMPEVIEALNHD